MKELYLKLDKNDKIYVVNDNESIVIKNNEVSLAVKPVSNTQFKYKILSDSKIDDIVDVCALEEIINSDKNLKNKEILNYKIQVAVIYK